MVNSLTSAVEIILAEINSLPLPLVALGEVGCYNCPMKQVPFVANSSDDMHCVNAVFRMVYQYFLGKDLTWRQIDKLTKAIPGKGTWTFVGEMEFAKKGIKVRNIEPVDYEKLYKEGVKYLNKVVGKDTANYYFNKSNIESVIPYIPQYLKIVEHETRRASINEIIKFLKAGSLIGVEINSRILNKKEGFSLHFVLLYDYDGGHFILHDPGLPSIKGRRVSLEEFKKAFSFPGSNGAITIFSN